ncbi:MAG: FkbM family methyltransferase [Lachnospiraceae bacterium]|nr:FkbM family methyltransferase [Lachnospiraceae bacterium]
MKEERFERLRILLSPIRERNIFLYGAGRRGKAAISNLKLFNLADNVLGFIDDAGNSDYCDKPVCPISDIDEEKKENCVFIITTYAINNMSRRLMENGVAARNIYFFAELLIDDIASDSFAKNNEKIQKVYDLLQDDLSKYIYKSIYEVYETGNIEVLSRTQGDCQYFPTEDANDCVDTFTLSEQEIFVDCGAYTGDTIEVFKKQTNDVYKKIYAFEPEINNCKIMENKYACDNRISIFPYGNWNNDETLRFREGKGTTSEIAEDGNCEIQVRKLDSVIEPEDEVTFIKMDIEGSEKEALTGGREIIKRYKPKLAICIYHKLEDLWEIPLLIHKLCPEYKLYIRNYTDRLDETVCYAVYDKTGG